MAQQPCSSCGRPVNPAVKCPYCGHENALDDELTRIEQSIAEIKIRDMEIANERAVLASKMQAALFQRDILAHANTERAKRATKTRRVRRRPARATVDADPPWTIDDGAVLVEDPPPQRPRRTGRAPIVEPLPAEHEPEASTRSVQNILLGLGALLLGVSAVVFAAVAVSNAFGRFTILAAGAALALAVAPGVSRRGLTATAETIAAVGLALVPICGYTVHGTALFGGPGVSEQRFLGVTFALTSVFAFWYAGASKLAAARYATVFALQPVPLLLAYPAIESPAGWALALTAVAVLDLLLLTTLIRADRRGSSRPWDRVLAADRTGLTEAAARRRGAADVDAAKQQVAGEPDSPDPASPDSAEPDSAEPDAAAGPAVLEPVSPAPDGPDEPGSRPETAPEEPDLVIDALAAPKRRQLFAGSRVFPGPRPSDAPPTGAPAAPVPPATWLRELTFVLLAIAVGGALVYGSVALLSANVTWDALRSGVILVLAAATMATAARLLGKVRSRNVAGAVLTLAIIGATARTVAIGAPAWTLAAAAAVVALTGAVVRLVPDEVRRGPQLASAAALAVIGLVIALDAVRAAFAPVQAARPVWQADLAAYADRIAAAAGPSGWLLALAALLLTVAAALALPSEARHPAAVAGFALTALSVPASLGMRWSEAPWPLVVAAIGLGGAGLLATTRRNAIAHIAAAGVVGLFGAGAALSAPYLTAATLTALAGAGIMVAVAARQLPTRLYAWLIGDWAAGAAALALPGAVVTAGLALAAHGNGLPPTSATVPTLAAGYLAVACTLTYAAVSQVARREISTPLTIGTGLGALAVTMAALRAPGAGAPDLWVAGLLLVACGLLFFAPTIDSSRRSDRLLDGPDIAAAGATVAVVGALTRVCALMAPGRTLVLAAVVVLGVALGIRLLPVDWRRGPSRGIALAGAIVGGIAGWQALSGGLRVLAAPGPLWASDLTGWSAAAEPGAWQAPVALALLAVASAAALPRPAAYDVAAICAGLATIGTPAALGLPWWSPLLVGGAVGLGYGVASVLAADPRAATARAGVAAAVTLHAAGAAMVRPWSTAVALGIIVALGVVVAALARLDLAPLELNPDEPRRRDLTAFGRAARRNAPDYGPDVVDLALDDTGMPRHRAQIGGAATAGALLALPGVFAALAAGQGSSAQVVLAAALAASSISLAVLAVVGRAMAQYLPYATVGLVGGATVTALFSLPTDHPTALYAAAAALLGVVAELLRGAVAPPGVTVAPDRRWSPTRHPVRQWTAARPQGLRGRWAVDPATGAVAVATLPTVLALISIAPVLVAALVDPFQQLRAIWQGPVDALANPVLAGPVDGTSVLAAVLLTVAAALAAVGFGRRPGESVPVILPGLAVTLLIAPVALQAPWPAATGAALVVFTISMLGLAGTPPPIASRAPLLRATRIVVFIIGLAAGGAGLSGSLATKPLTLFTLGSAVGVGLVAALIGRTQHARILGWLFAALFGQLFALTAGLVAGLDPAWSAFGVLAVGAALLVLEATLPRLGRPENLREAITVEWSGYAAALLALALAVNAPPQLAALLAAWGAVLGLAATRRGRRAIERRTLFWVAVGFEIVAWWLLMTISEVVLPEAYTLPFAALALLVGLLEAKHRPDLSSWAAYGPALLAAFVPTVAIVLATDAGAVRELLLLLGAVGTLIVGSRLQQQAPVVVGAAVTAIVALHYTVTLVGPWLVLVPIGMVLLVLGATNENRRRTQERLRGALVRMR
ncbi:MAG TPA: hypothetical protein VFO77_00940 [Actinoplanes sp.]|nr:hypothetical protein [Actinoplanes sp.]